MKKSLIALAVLAASGAAMAQSSVTLYGIADANFGQRKVTTTAGANTTVVKNTGIFDGGANGLSASRWGIRGTEDLGGGLKANFNLEQRLNVNDGTLNSLKQFNGRSVVGLSGGFGSVDLGRDYTPLFLLSNASDVDGFSPYTTTSAGIVRRDSSFNYTSPNFSGFTVKAQVGHNTSKTTLNGAVPVGGEAKNNGLGLSGVYASGPLMVGLAYDGQKGLSGAPETKALGLGASYDFSVAKLFANVKQSKTTQAIAPTESKDREFNLGVSAPLGAASLIAGVGRNKTEVAGVSTTKTDFVLGADYNLSKRTKAYFRTGGDKQTSSSVGSATVKSVGYGIGIRHVF